MAGARIHRYYVRLAARPSDGFGYFFRGFGRIREHTAAPARTVDFATQGTCAQGRVEHPVDFRRGDAEHVAENGVMVGEQLAKPVVIDPGALQNGEGVAENIAVDELAFEKLVR